MAPKQYDGQVIRHAFEMYKQHKSFRKAAQHSLASKSTIQRWWVRIGRINRHDKVKRKVHARKYNIYKDEIYKSVSADGFTTLQAIQLELSRAHPFERNISLSTVSRILKALKFRRKRIKTHVTYCKPEVLATKIRTFQDLIKDIPLSDIISIDETGFGTHANAYFKYTTSNVEERFEVPVRTRRSCVMGVTIQGLVCTEFYQTQAAPFNTNHFVGYITRLLPVLPPNIRVLMMDNINFHHSKRVTQLVDAHGLKVIFTPPYSPRFNPIENTFSVIKQTFRKEYLASLDLDSSMQYAIDCYQQNHTDLSKTFEHCVHCPK